MFLMFAIMPLSGVLLFALEGWLSSLEIYSVSDDTMPVFPPLDLIDFELSKIAAEVAARRDRPQADYPSSARAASRSSEARRRSEVVHRARGTRLSSISWVQS